MKYAWVIAVLPFVSAFLTLFFGKRVPGKGSIFGIAAIGAGLAMALGGILLHFVQHGGDTYAASVGWFHIGTLHLQLGEYIDGLTAVMLVIVTGVSLMVHIYSLGYMKGDARYTWYYVVLSLFTGAMLNVVIADNLFQLLVGWEIMGVCSYLLIGHWWEEKDNSNAAIKAFITTRIGDVPFLFGIFVLTLATGFTTTNIQHIGEVVSRPATSTLLVSAAALLLFGGTIGKSAQFPLYVWLPDAMAGPAPVSALIHAATMVAAGIYMVARLFQVFVHADPIVLTIVSIIGAITLLLAAFLALVQDDIKKVLAYSTISQLAYMVAALGMGQAGYPAAMFHLFTHAFFKALLFLGAGSVIHAVHSNDMSDMGGLRKFMPRTYKTYLIGALALAGIPPLAGFFSKDEIVLVAFKTHTFWLAGSLLFGALLTAFYTSRMVVKTFFGEYRGHGTPHESPHTMTAPLVVLAVTTVFAGLLGFAPAGAPFLDWVYFGRPEVPEFNPIVALVSASIALIGVFAAWRVYIKEPAKDPMLEMGKFSTVLENRYYLDNFYLRYIVRPIQYRLSAATNWFNKWILDGIVNGTAWVGRVFLAGAVSWFDRRIVDGAVNGVGEITGETGGLLKYLQSGNVQRYAVFLFGGVLILTVVIVNVK